MTKLKIYFSFFLVGLGFTTLMALRDMSRSYLLIEEFIPDDFFEHFQSLFYNIGYFFVLLFGILIIIESTKQLIKK